MVRELRRIHQEELEHRARLEMKGVQDPARQGVPLPRFRLGYIDKDTEEYDERVRARVGRAGVAQVNERMAKSIDIELGEGGR